MDLDEVLDHVEDEPSHFNHIIVLRPKTGDHVYINCMESSTAPWLSQHHGVVVSGHSESSTKICHFHACSSETPSITESSLMGFSNGSDVYLYPHQRTRTNAIRFAKACIGKMGYNSRTFNCEHFANMCITGCAASPMADRAMWIIMGVTGTALTVFGGATGAAVWMAGKTALVGKYIYDKFGVSESRDGIHDSCALCNSRKDVVTIRNCKHTVCLDCGRNKGNSVVCPVNDCFADFFEFQIDHRKYIVRSAVVQYERKIIAVSL